MDAEIDPIFSKDRRMKKLLDTYPRAIDIRNGKPRTWLSKLLRSRLVPTRYLEEILRKAEYINQLTIRIEHELDEIRIYRHNLIEIERRLKIIENKSEFTDEAVASRLRDSIRKSSEEDGFPI